MEGKLEVKIIVPNQPLDKFKTSTDADDCFLKIDTIIAKPTTTSAAVGEKKESKILEAGGGKKSGEDKTSNIVEAGGGKKITKETAQAEFEEEKSILEEE